MGVLDRARDLARGPLTLLVDHVGQDHGGTAGGEEPTLGRTLAPGPGLHR